MSASQELMIVAQAQGGGTGLWDTTTKLGCGSGSSVAQPNAPLIFFISCCSVLGQRAAFKSRNSV